MDTRQGFPEENYHLNEDLVDSVDRDSSTGFPDVDPPGEASSSLPAFGGCWRRGTGRGLPPTCGSGRDVPSPAPIDRAGRHLPGTRRRRLEDRFRSSRHCMGGWAKCASGGVRDIAPTAPTPSAGLVVPGPMGGELLFITISGGGQAGEVAQPRLSSRTASPDLGGMVAPDRRRISCAPPATGAGTAGNTDSAPQAGERRPLINCGGWGFHPRRHGQAADSAIVAGKPFTAANLPRCSV